MTGTVGGYIRLARPANMLICGFSVVCGGIIGGKPLDLLTEFIACIGSGSLPVWAVRTLWAALSASLILAAGNTFNDICDITTDSINAPDRPLPSGKVSAGGASFFTGLLTVTGLASSLPLGKAGVAVALGAVFLLAAYDAWLKAVPFAGNVSVAILGGLAFVYGGIAGGCIYRALIPAVFATLFHLGREVIKDAADTRGDREAGIRTIATVHGEQVACRIGALVLTALAVIVVAPSVTGYFGVVYTIYIALLVCPILLYAAASSLRDQGEANLRRISMILKIDMPVGIIAVLAGFQGW